MERALTLGIDISTQSISAVVLDPRESPARAVAHLSLSYRDDSRLNRFGIHRESLLVPPRVPGEADQPPEMFLAGLDALLGDLAAAGVRLGQVGAVSVSAQQHGHVYLTEAGLEAIAALGRGGESPLVKRFDGAFSYGTAPIWQTSNSQPQAEEIRDALGGVLPVVERSGSNSPARFTGAVIRRTAQTVPSIWEKTARISLLSSFFSAILSGNPDCPIDWGNGSGMTLMDYHTRQWSPELLQAVSQGLPGGADALRAKLPGLASPVAESGRIARYFQERFGFSQDCIVNAGSGDNPQSKVMIRGDLLSLGTSFVYMVDTGTPLVDRSGYANSMYDGLGNPFVFACRTNGAMVWDRLRGIYGADLARAEAALEKVRPGAETIVWQPYAESYPQVPPIDLEEARSGGGDFSRLYSGIVDSSLVLTRHYAGTFEVSREPLALTGGPSASLAIRQRVAAIFERPVIVLESSGAALGSALAAWQTLCNARGHKAELDRLRQDLVPSGEMVYPDSTMASAYRELASRLIRRAPFASSPSASG
ncbi:xylulokinase [Alkalispirochaeta americana]|uniref:Xylulokinase n=1 Tax=Alkalispirochaeta americana TaxID=159291 RepID=A0A1N6N5Q7_9SPIO|nr:FGGY family carbohydrate kinase [Alkalispirochaeta americana]SIP87359.1 xylulokinase [Alkalispirochaeta americana]